MKSFWLKVSEKTVNDMMKSRADPELVLEGAMRLLVSKDGQVKSDLYYEAMKYVTREKFSGVGDAELLKIAGRGRGKSPEVLLAMLECKRRGVLG